MNNRIKFIRVLTIFLFQILLILPNLGLADTPIESKAEVSSDSHEVVVTYQNISTRIGYEILHSGGNAFDAFVAATFAQYVLAPGVTSPAGPLGVLVYEAKKRKISYLDAGLNEPLHPKDKWDSPEQPGSVFLVPGAVAGLEAISKRYGRLPFKRVLEPAIKLASEGFSIFAQYEFLVSLNREKLKRSEYGENTYLSNGIGLLWGDKIRFPEMANFLSGLSEEGSSYFYQGDWAKKCVEEVRRQGGRLSLEDLSSYRVKWLEPWKVSYRGYDLFSTAGRNIGGLITLETLKVLENTNVTNYGKHYSLSADGMEIMVRAFRGSENKVTSDVWNGGYKMLDNPNYISSVLGKGNTERIWKNVIQKERLPLNKGTGSHSWQIVVVDKDGNVVTGTNTISGDLWGEGIFVEGIPLNASGKLKFASTQPGERILSPLSMQIGVKGGKVRFALGSFDESLVSTSFQFITNLIDYKLSAKDAVSLPRFGKEERLDKRVNKDIVAALANRGITFTQDGYYVETGLGSVAVIQEDGTVEGAVAPLSGLSDQSEVDYQKAKPDAEIPSVRPYLKIDKSAHGKTWGDMTKGGKIISKIKHGALELLIETGTGWGCMASNPSNIGPFVAPGIVDVKGYNFFQFKALVPKGLLFRNFLIESGMDISSQSVNKGVNGADGEIYIFPSFQGTGKWETYRLNLSKLGICAGWGNQQGNKILDLQALSGVIFQFIGNQGNGKVLIKDLKFMVK